MRWPRPRLTVRRLMILVALAALVIVYVIPAARFLIGAYRAPMSLLRFESSVFIRPDWCNLPDPTPHAPTLMPMMPFTVEVRSILIPAVDLPAHLPYRVDLEARVVDAANVATIYETQHRSWWIWTGAASHDGEIDAHFFRFRRAEPGRYAVEFDLFATDILGRRNMAARAPAFFNVK